MKNDNLLIECAGLWSNHMNKEEIRKINDNIKKRKELSIKTKKEKIEKIINGKD